MSVEAQAAEIDWDRLIAGRTFHPSPAAWEDEVLYFLMLDRFSDGTEHGFSDNGGRAVPASAQASTPPFEESGRGNAVSTEPSAARWREAGTRWCGGTLAGLSSKIGYLKRLGVTAIWVSPVLKQVAFRETYHGYGVQNFLDVDPHFGTRDDLRAMVQTAHAHGIRVVLDVILNHAGDVFSYDPDRYLVKGENGASDRFDPRWDGKAYRVCGFNDRTGQPTLPFAPVQQAAGAPTTDAVWPAELQEPGTFTCRGRINNWDYDPEFRDGDFLDLKDVHLGTGGADDYAPSAALKTLCEIYKFWIAFADLDGFRIDTVKHMDLGAARFFASSVHEFAQILGKDNFYLIGEITGGRSRAYLTLEETGIDAALGIDDIPDKLEYMVKGYREPSDYFGLFRNSLLIGKGSHVWFRDKVVTVLDDHDQVRKGESKARFAADGPPETLALAALALNATTLGIPCIYYGSEQLFDGAGHSDRYLRECMFGGAFGAMGSTGCHFFREETWLYRELAQVLALRRSEPALRRGRQYLREISGNGTDFGLPRMIGGEIRSVVPWSRLLDRTELLLAINTDRSSTRTAWTVVDRDLHEIGDTLKCLYSTDPADLSQSLEVEGRPDGRHVVSLSVPAAGFVVYR